MQTGSTFLMDNGGNLIGTPGSPIDPLLGPLAANGGPTMTHALLTGSPAIDAGDPSAFPGVGNVPLYDQRGAPFSRVFDGDGIDGQRIDIGAFEVQPVGPALPGDYNQNGVVDAADYVLWRKYESTSTPLANDAIGGVIGPAHYDQWTANFGQSLSAAGSGASDESQVEGQASRAADEGLRIADFGLRSEASRESRVKSQRPEQVATGARRWRDDALVAWLASGEIGRARDEVEVGAIVRDDDEHFVEYGESEALHIAFDALADSVSS
jgi:hypothetical protein